MLLLDVPLPQGLPSMKASLKVPLGVLEDAIDASLASGTLPMQLSLRFALGVLGPAAKSDASLLTSSLTRDFGVL